MLNIKPITKEELINRIESILKVCAHCKVEFFPNTPKSIYCNACLTTSGLVDTRKYNYKVKKLKPKKIKRAKSIKRQDVVPVLCKVCSKVCLQGKKESSTRYSTRKTCSYICRPIWQARRVKYIKNE
jgi:hypothetical protein